MTHEMRKELTDPQLPVWQRCEHVCIPQSNSFPQVSPQVGTSSVHGKL